MNRNAIYYMISVALVCSAFTACDNDSSELTWGSVVNKSIRVKNVSSSEVITKSGEESKVETSEVTLANGSVFTIEKTQMPYFSEFDTKAVELTTSNLSEFTLYGWLEKDDLVGRVAASTGDIDYPNFITGSVYSKTSDGWAANSDNKWRNMVTHYFWAQSGLTDMDTDPTTASFSYSPTGAPEDVVVAYTESPAAVHSETADCENDAIDLTFKHALSAVQVKLGTINAVQDNGKGIQPGRVVDVVSKVLSYSTSGECNVNTELDFSWSKQSVTKAYSFNGDGSDVFFAVPQNGGSITLNIVDSWTGAQFPTVISTGDTWESAYRYRYSINGTVTVPYVNSEPDTPAWDLSFGKKQGWDYKPISSLNANIFKTLGVSWENVPTTSNGSAYVFIYFAKEPYKPSSDHGQIPLGEIQEALKGKLAFQYNTADRTAGPGSVSGNNCSFDFDLSAFSGDVNMYIAVWLSNASMKFSPENFKVEVTDYK